LVSGLRVPQIPGPGAYLDLEADQVERRWRERGNPIIVARAVSDVARYGALVVEEGEVKGFLEKGGSGPG
jgi:hypothetical protein